MQRHLIHGIYGKPSLSKPVPAAEPPAGPRNFTLPQQADSLNLHKKQPERGR